MTQARLLTQAGVAGLLVGIIFAASWNSRPYTSVAVLRVAPSSVPESLVPRQAQSGVESHLQDIAQVVTSRASLLNLITRLSLYPGERAVMPAQDVVIRMRSGIRITQAKDSLLEISFTYPDRMLAQRTGAELVNSFIQEYLREQEVQIRSNLQLMQDLAEKAVAVWEESLRNVRAAEAERRMTERLRLDSEIARQRYEILRQKIAEAEVLREIERRQQGQRLELLDPASVPADSHVSAVVCAIAGAVCGVFLAWLASMVFGLRTRERNVAQPWGSPS